MGLFDKINDLVDGAKDKVGEVTGFDADKLMEAGGSVVDAGESVDKAVSAIEDGKLGA